MQDQLTVRLPEDLSRDLKAASRRMQRKSSVVFTTDGRDFAVYRIKGRCRFELLPG